jgi:hypothetical protein
MLPKEFTDEQVYRKVTGIMQGSKIRPLVISTSAVDDMLTIKHHGRTLLEISKSDFNTLTANEILAKMDGSNNGD